MTWKSITALRREYRSNEAGRKKLVELFAVRQFVRFALRAPSFLPTSEVTDAICLNQHGKEQLEYLRSQNGGVEEGLIKFAVFLIFLPSRPIRRPRSDKNWAHTRTCA
jgi:hypothetical protein